MDPKALEDLLELQDVLHILLASELRFEAHHWGSYVLFEAHKHDKGILPIARSLAQPEHFIYYDALRKGFYIPAKTPLQVAKQLGEFIDLPQAGQSYSRGQHFDKRKSLAELLPASDFLVSSISKRDVFGFTESYEVLVQLAVKLSAGAFQPDEISALQLPDNKREIRLKLQDRVHSIRLAGNYFDDEFLHGLNLFLIDAGQSDFKFAATWNSDGFFTLLKLAPEQFSDLERMGVLQWSD